MELAPALQLHEVSKRYGAQWALLRLTLKLRRGAALLLTGHNGSGKTTLLRVLATAVRPSSGKVEILGLDAAVDPEKVRTQVGLLSHANFVYEDLSGLENLRVLARLLGASPSVAGEALERLGLSQKDDRPVRTYSAGMRRRLALARLFLKQPAVALLDEPFVELDPTGVSELEARIRELRAAGTTLVLATHHIEQGLQLCTDRLHLEQGRSIAA
ncbi:MAG TPA: heme ABC exporter ATP-binding protein CcmA [Myxococcaceae bacterium]|nr:heme ABC exporter ATP-binding protein CcmA [Myxococcaceae bacterium]